MKRSLILCVFLLVSLSCSIALAEEAAPAPTDAKAAVAAENAAPADAKPADEAAAPAAEKKAKPAKPAEDPALTKANNLIKKAQAAMRKVKDYTFTFYKQEYKGKMLPKEKIEVKLRVKPRSIYMKWIGKEKKNQETIWRPGWNKGKIRAHKGSFPDVTVNLKTDAWMAMKDNRHPVTEAGFKHTIALIAKDMKLAKMHPEWGAKIVDLGDKKVFGVLSTCYEASTDKDKHPEFYSYKALICANKKNHLPNKVQIWDKEDGKVRLVEDYGYENVKLNVGLTNEDFNPDNKEYNF